METMKSISKTIQVVNSLIGNKNYDLAIRKMYEGTQYSRGYEKLLEKINTGVEFFTACNLHEKSVDDQLARIEAAKKSKKVREWISAHKEWKSGYAMGEYVKIVFQTPDIQIHDLIADRTDYYGGKHANRYNRNVRHGKAVLYVNLTCAKAKYSEEYISK